MNPHKGIGTESRGIPLFFYQKGKLSLYGPMMNYSLIKDAGWEFRALARMRFEGYEEDDSRYLRGMAHHKIWRYWHAWNANGGYGDKDPRNVRQQLQRCLQYAIYPPVYPYSQ